MQLLFFLSKTCNTLWYAGCFMQILHFSSDRVLLQKRRYEKRTVYSPCIPLPHE